MRIQAKFITDIRKEMQAVEREGRVAVRAGLEAAATGLRDEWRGQVVSAGLGARLARTIRSQAYPRQPSSNAAAMVWTRAPQIIDAFERGTLIRSTRGFFLAIPTKDAGHNLRGGRITPGEWEQRTGVRLRYVHRKGKPPILVAEMRARQGKRGGFAAPSATALRTGRNITTVVMFVLVPQVRLPKRLDFAGAANRWAARAPGMIVHSWPEST